MSFVQSKFGIDGCVTECTETVKETPNAKLHNTTTNYNTYFKTISDVFQLNAQLRETFNEFANKI